MSPSRRELITTILGSRPMDQLGRHIFRRPIRVAAFHAVTDEHRFAEILRYVSCHYDVLTPGGVVESLHDARKQRRPAVWLTFDDGHPSVFEVGLPLLREHGLTATAFVCPSVIDTKTPLWFQLVRGCAGHGLDWPHGEDRLDRDADAVMRALKSLPDAERREACDDLAQRAARAGCPAVEMQQARLVDLRRWAEAGNSIGNHTWDHPMLDRCSDDVVDAQIRSTDAWLHEVDLWSAAFAYPDGAWNPVAERTMRALGVSLGAGFDHRLAQRSMDPYRTSRLAIDADAPISRARAVISGMHPVVFEAFGDRQDRRAMQ